LTPIRQRPIQWLDQVTDGVPRRAGRFKAVHRVSLADALIAAFAAEARTILIHKDPEYEALSRSVKQETLPYIMTFQEARCASLFSPYS